MWGGELVAPIREVASDRRMMAFDLPLALGGREKLDGLNRTPDCHLPGWHLEAGSIEIPLDSIKWFGYNTLRRKPGRVGWGLYGGPPLRDVWLSFSISRAAAAALRRGG